jgi:hypothetical protein
MTSGKAGGVKFVNRSKRLALAFFEQFQPIQSFVLCLLLPIALPIHAIFPPDIP